MIIIRCSDQKIEWALKKYRQKVEKVGQLKELRDRKEFEKPSIKKKKQRDKAKYREKHGHRNF